jgi:O-methyltransferase involved in polyketide biosynthesis
MEKLNLGIVQETLLLPLAARAYDAERKKPILNDRKAAELFRKVVGNKESAGKMNRNTLRKYIHDIGIVSMCERAMIMDNAVKDFLKENPKGKILNIGVGLETSFYRLGEPDVPWFDLDLPDSLELREQLLPNHFKNVKNIPKSMFDVSWMDDVGDISDGLMITVPGVFPYFDEEHVKNFFNTFAPKLKGAEIIFDVTSNIGRFFIGQRIKMAGMKSATLDWGIMNPHEMEQWNEHIQLKTSHYFLQHPVFSRSANPFYRFMSWNNKFFKTGQIFHFKFV